MFQGVQVCIPSRSYHFDLKVLAHADAAVRYAQQLGIPAELAQIADAYSTATCRNRGVAGFLEKNYSYLLFVDADVYIPPNTIMSLMGRGDVASGCIPAVRKAEKTTAYVQVRTMGGDWLTSWPKQDMEAEQVGGGCMMIRREVLVALGHPWFRWPEQYTPGEGLRATTDDTDFCDRVREKGYSIMVVAGVRCGHEKSVDVSILIPE